LESTEWMESPTHVQQAYHLTAGCCWYIAMVVPIYLIGCKAAVRRSKAHLIKIPLWDGPREVVVVEPQSMQMHPGTAINATVRLWHRPAEVVLLADKTQSSKKALQMLVLFLSCYCSPAPPTFSPISTTQAEDTLMSAQHQTCTCSWECNHQEEVSVATLLLTEISKATRRHLPSCFAGP